MHYSYLLLDIISVVIIFGIIFIAPNSFLNTWYWFLGTIYIHATYYLYTIPSNSSTSSCKEMVMLRSVTLTAVTVLYLTDCRPLVPLYALLHSDMSLCVLNFLRNLKMYLQLISFLHNDITQLVEILPHIRQELYYSTKTISWVLISWWHNEQVHQQPWYCLSLTGIISSQHAKNW